MSVFGVNVEVLLAALVVETVDGLAIPGKESPRAIPVLVYNE